MLYTGLSPLLYLPVLGFGSGMTRAAATAAEEPDLSRLPDLLKSISADVFPGLKALAQDIHANPETSTREHHAHDTVVAYFTEQVPGLWEVTPHAYGEPTAFALDFTHTPAGYAAGPDPPPAVGFMAEYDALLGIGHACGHNHILLNGLAAATAARQALVELGIPGRIRMLGTPDEENTAGKARLLDKGAFDDGGGIDVWLMAHPTSANAIQPMQARVNAAAAFSADRHTDAVRAAYEALVAVVDLAGTLPGTASSAMPVEDVGMFSTNVVAQRVEFGIAGLGVDEVRKTVAALLDDTYPGVEYSVTASGDVVEGGSGVNLTVTGPGGHASEGTKSPLRLTIETFRSLTGSGKEGLSFFLPGNTTVTELAVTTSVRTRYTADLDAVLAEVEPALSGHASGAIATDRPYAALEVVRPLGDRFIALMRDADHDDGGNWGYSATAPAATDAGLVEEPTLDPETRELLAVRRAVLHANYDICDRAAGAASPCGFNHEPVFERTAATEYSYARTEVVARAQAQMAVEAIADERVMAGFVSLVRR
ncbi:hypothetical protein F5X99DRAFT_371412 [Biscogniauxia marginata]|nr:hypothetical protein F5X99DRAFT_371412 [Biscogniauxia marginata]